jgi:hypothetical protein
MVDKIRNHIKERESLNKELRRIIKHLADDNQSPIEIFEGEWKIKGIELLIQHSDDSLEEDGVPYIISTMWGVGNELFMGEDGDYTYVMAYPFDGETSDTTIFVLENKNKQ